MLIENEKFLQGTQKELRSQETKGSNTLKNYEKDSALNRLSLL